MNQLQIFENPEFGAVRTVEIDGDPWLVGKDVAQALGYAKPENAIGTHVDSEDKTTTLIQDVYKRQNQGFIENPPDRKRS